MQFNSSLLLSFSALLIIGGCGGSSSGSAGDLTSPEKNVNWQPVSSSSWSIGDARLENFDIAKLNTAYNKAANSKVLKNLLVVRNEQLIAEAYFDGTSVETLFQERSVTKTIMAMLIGIAIDEGSLSGLDQSIGIFFENDYPDLSIEQKDISIRQLLTMTSGFEWDESQAEDYANWANSVDPQGYLLDRNLISAPGSAFNYNSAAVHLLSVILTKVTGMSTLDYADQKLFQPLGISDIRWEILGDGVYNGSAGLEMQAADLAKIALMIFNDGSWQQQIIVPSRWVEDVKSYQISLTPDLGPFLVDGYGYLIWLGKGNQHLIQLAWGWGGQFIALVPEKNMLVIINSEWLVDAATARSQYDIALDIIINHIIAAAN